MSSVVANVQVTRFASSTDKAILVSEAKINCMMRARDGRKSILLCIC